MNREELIAGASTLGLGSESVINFDKHLPPTGPYSDQVVDQALWEAVVEGVPPPVVRDVTFISPLLIFVVELENPVFD